MSRSNALFQPSPQPVVDEILESATKRGDKLAAPFIQQLEQEYKGLNSLGKNTALEWFSKMIELLSHYSYANIEKRNVDLYTGQLIGEARAFNDVLKRNSSHAIDEEQLNKILQELQKIPNTAYISDHKKFIGFHCEFHQLINQINFTFADAVLLAKNEITMKFRKQALAEIIELRGMITKQLEQKPDADEDQPGAAVLKR